MTSNRSDDKVSVKGSMSGGSIGSSVTSGWLGELLSSSLLDFFGDGGEMLSFVSYKMVTSCE